MWQVDLESPLMGRIHQLEGLLVQETQRRMMAESENERLKSLIDTLHQRLASFVRHTLRASLFKKRLLGNKNKCLTREIQLTKAFLRMVWNWEESVNNMQKFTPSTRGNPHKTPAILYRLKQDRISLFANGLCTLFPVWHRLWHGAAVARGTSELGQRHATDDPQFLSTAKQRHAKQHITPAEPSPLQPESAGERCGPLSLNSLQPLDVLRL